jgi:hypothetical protein
MTTGAVVTTQTAAMPVSLSIHHAMSANSFSIQKNMVNDQAIQADIPRATPSLGSLPET